LRFRDKLLLYWVKEQLLTRQQGDAEGHVKNTFASNIPPACVCPRWMAMAKPQKSTFKLLLVMMAGFALIWVAAVMAVHGL
jgi:hypothetical protein